MYERKDDFEQALAAAKDPNTDPKVLDELVSTHFGEIDIAHAVAENPSCSFRRFVEFYRYGVPTVTNNPSLATHQQHQNWEASVRRKPSTSPSRYSCEVGAVWPQIHKVLWVMEHGDSAFQRQVIGAEYIPEYVIRDHVGSKSAPLRKAIAKRKSAPLDIYLQLAKDRAKTVREALAANPSAPPEVIAGLAMDEDEAVADKARNNPGCPDDAVHRARLADASKPAVATDLDSLGFHELVRIAGAPDTSAETLAELANSDIGCVRFMVGFNASTPPVTLEKIAGDSEAWVQAGAAFNPSTPAAALASLMQSDNEDVLVGLASNPSLDEQDQLKLAETASNAARKAVANLTNYPSVWEALATQARPVKKKIDREWQHYIAEALKGDFVGMTMGQKSMLTCVARIAARSEKCPRNLLGFYVQYLFDDYRQNPAATLALLEGSTHAKPRQYKDWKLDKWLTDGAAPGHLANYLLRSDDEKRGPKALSSESADLVYVLPWLLKASTVDRKRAAARSDLNRFAFEMLLRDEKSGVRETVASNKACPRELLKLVEADRETTVRSAAGGRAKAGAPKGTVVNQGSATERARLAKRTKDEKVLEELQADRAASVRVAVAGNERAPASVLAALASDPEAKVRAVVGKRCRDTDVLRPMLQDDDAAVRLAASRNTRWRTYDEKRAGREYDREFLAEIAGSPDPALRELAAEYTEDPAQQEAFMRDVPEVTRRLALNMQLPADAKRRLAEISDDQDTLGALARRTTDEELFLIAAEKITSNHMNDPIRCHQEMLSRPRVQDRLCAHPLIMVRRALSYQPKLTPRAIEVLAKDPDDVTRRSVSKMLGR